VVNTQENEAFKIVNALSSPTRLKILQLLKDKKLNVNEVAQELGLPQSTIAVNIKVLEEAGLVTVDFSSGRRGSQKLCSAQYDEVVIQLPSLQKEVNEKVIMVEMPIGLYTDFNVTPPCGLCTRDEIVGYLDVPASFFNPTRAKAGLLWFETGYVEYKFPNNLPKKAKLKRLEITMELSSEVIGTNPNWPSDITVWINGVEIGTWTSPGDFGDRRGKLTPTWWKLAGSQYGIMTTWIVTQEGSFVKGNKTSKVSFDSLEIKNHTSVKVRIGVKEDAKNIGGVNIFGKTFGDYEQDIIMKMEFE